jgi:hypothetical protein
VPTFRREPTPADALSRYRNALVQGAPPEELARLAEPVDPEILETLHWTRQAGQRAQEAPDPRFAKRLESELLQGFATTTRPPLASLPASHTLPHTAPGTGQMHDPARVPPATQRRWTWRPLAVAAVLVALLAGSIAALRVVRFDPAETQLGAVGEPTTETFVDATLTGAAETWTPLTVEHWRFQEGESPLSIPPLDGPQWIVADGGGIVVTVDGEGRTLAPGESLVVPAGQALTLHNPGLGETSVYRGVAAAGFSFEDYDRAVISKETALNTAAHEALPPGQSHIVFDRLSIPPGTLITAEAATGQDWFDIVTGQLGLTLIGDVVPQGWESGRERELAADDPVPILVPGTSVTMRNVGDDPLVLLRLRVSPLSDDPSAETPAQ